MRRWTITIVMMIMAVSGCEAPLTRTDAPTHRNAIINGIPTNYESWKSVLMVYNSEVTCSGTLIRDRVVLTAAHCIVMDDETLDYDFSDTPEEISIRGGAQGEIVFSAAEEIIVHPEWHGRVGLSAPDLALIRLETSISDLAPFQLRDFPSTLPGTGGVIVGYGTNPEIIVDQQMPVHRYGETTIIGVSPYLLETGGDANTCLGDSGGPLFTEKAGEWVLTGVTSAGFEKACDVEAGGFSVNLLSYCGFLNASMMTLTGEDLGLSLCGECDALSAVAWGAPCGPGYPSCPEGTRCRTPDSFSEEGLGFCAPSCCSLGEADIAYCPDVSDGDAFCAFEERSEAYCAVLCRNDEDCIEGTACVENADSGNKICITVDVGPDTADRGTAPVKDTDPAADTGDSEMPSDAGEDTAEDSAPLTPSANSHKDGCGCHTPAQSPPAVSWFQLIGVLK